MKKILSCILSAVCFCGVSYAQLKEACSFYVYDYNNVPEVTPAPDGYKPFYISQFARHGARYCTSEYSRLYNCLSKASAEGKLTDAGKEFFSRYEPFYQQVKNCSGNLTGVGKAQHRAIAMRLYERFPEVFKGATNIEAVSTESPRVIMSMWSCLSQLAALDTDLNINADASAKYASWLQPSLSSNPYYVKGGFKCCDAATEALEDYFYKVVPCKEIVEKFLVNTDVLEKDLKTTTRKFISDLHAVVTATYCLDEDRGCFDDVFTPEQLQQVYKGLSAAYFLDVANYVGSGHNVLDYAHFTLEQIIESADADIASGKTQLRLRYGHDSGIGPLITVFDINGYGRPATSFEEGLEIFPSYCVPMGASVQLVFFKNKKGDILVKVLLSEQEVTLPFEAAQGPYYRWEDFKKYYTPRISEAKKKVENLILL